VSFLIYAVDSNASQALTFAATGLPPGIKIAPNDTNSGSGSKLGTWTVTVTATDTEGVSGAATFVWSVVRLPRAPAAALQPARHGKRATLGPGTTTGPAQRAPRTCVAGGG
jgi:Putative Ig domain